MQLFKWYVTRGHSIQDLLDTTFAERILLREAYREYCEALESVGKE